MQVNKIAVIGSGVMGSGIAAQAANGGLSVLLLDIVPPGARNRNALAEKAIDGQLKAGGFAHPSRKDNITAGNLEDDLESLDEADWIIEVVVEKLEIKHKVYQQIEAARKAGSIVSSNTSTIPLSELIGPMPDSFKQDFMISHFFNPPRLMRLIETVPAPAMDAERYQAACDVADEIFGKAVVHCKDTPGFIANRIGIYWMTLAMNKALEHGMRLEAVDQLMSKPIGAPKTGVFGLYDLIGLDLMPLIAEAMKDYVDDGDPFHALEEKPLLLKNMIDDGYIGRKGLGGFYKMDKLPDGGKSLMALDLSTGSYHPVFKSAILESARSKDISVLLATQDMGGVYARDVMVHTLHYAASLLGEISDDMYSIDQAMKNGYSWKFGPFELIDQIGAQKFTIYCTDLELDVPEIVRLAGTGRLYQDNTQLGLDGAYVQLPRTKGALKLTDQGVAVEEFEAGNLWAMGDDVYCLEITSKMHAINDTVLTALEGALEYVQANGAALVIGSEASLFSAGADLTFFLSQAESGELDKVERLIAHGQQIMQKVKYSDVPTVSALTGIALGGGCELLLHSTKVQPHLECYTGLVEVGVGLIPAWGGCKEMLLRRVMSQANDEDKIKALRELLADIVGMKSARSAYEAMDLSIVTGDDVVVTMNSDRLLGDAKRVALNCAGQPARTEQKISLPAGSKAALEAWLTDQEENLQPHGRHIAGQLIEVLSLAENTSISEQDVLDKEREIFIQLLAMDKTKQRIEHMLGSGKPLSN